MRAHRLTARRPCRCRPAAAQPAGVISEEYVAKLRQMHKQLSISKECFERTAKALASTGATHAATAAQGGWGVALVMAALRSLEDIPGVAERSSGGGKKRELAGNAPEKGKASEKGKAQGKGKALAKGRPRKKAKQ